MFTTLGGGELPRIPVTQQSNRIRDEAPGPLHAQRLDDGAEHAFHVDQARTKTRPDREGLYADAVEIGDHLGFEAVEQLADRFVDAGDACDGDRSRDDAHLVCAVARIVGLPQGVAAPPATHVFVDDRDEIDRLAGRTAQVEEEDQVGRVEYVGVGSRVHRDQRIDGCTGIVGGRRVTEERRDLTAVGIVETGFGALQHLDEALAPRDVDPCRGPGGLTHGELDITLEPLPVGHLRHIAEVRLRGSGERLDDLVATSLHGLFVTGHLVEQSTTSRRGVVDLVDVGAELASARGHSGSRVACADPLVAARGVDQEFFDRRRCGRLLGGHGGGADQDAVEGHERVVVGS